MIYHFSDGKWKPTQFKSLTSVKHCATRSWHAACRMDGEVLVVSTPDGSIHRYKASKTGALP